MAIPITITPPSSAFPSLALPPFPWCNGTSTANGCIASGVPYPNFSYLVIWIIQCIFIFLEWIVAVILYGLNWGLYTLADGAASFVSMVVNGALTVINAYWSAASALANFTGPLAPITASIFVSFFVLLTVFAFLVLMGLFSRTLGKATSEIEGPGESGSGGDAEVEEMAVA